MFHTNKAADGKLRVGRLYPTRWSPWEEGTRFLSLCSAGREFRYGIDSGRSEDDKKSRSKAYRIA